MFSAASGPQRPNLSESSAPAGTVIRAGQRLQQARLNKGWSVVEAAERIRVKPEFIAALEAMNVKLLPGKAFAIAYLRSYAGLLGLPVEELVDQFRRECALTREDATPQIHDPVSKPARERPWVLALAPAILAAGFIGWRALIVNSPQQAAAPVTEVAAPAQPAGPIAPEAPVDEDAFGLSAQRVEVRALKDAKIEVRASNGTVFYEGVLPTGRALYPDSGAGWTLHAQDGAAFEVFLNGQSVGTLGAANAPVLGRRVDAIAAIALQG
jgi:transcriptional regulator with XRE-family HTH domain